MHLPSLANMFLMAGGHAPAVQDRVQGLALALLIAAVVAMLTRRLRLPYSVGLVAAGIVLAMFSLGGNFALSKEIIYVALLPPLLFDAAFHLRLDRLRRNLPPVAVLATIGVLLSACVCAVGMHFLVHWEWIGALLFGVLIAATDAVSVVEIFKEAKVHGRLFTLIEGESLFNDGTVVVSLGIVVVLASGRTPTPMEIGFLLLKVILGGILCGAAVAIGALMLAGRTNDRLVEVTFTTVAAYGSFLLADRFGMSGVLATITAGIVMSNRRSPDVISQGGKEAIETFWEYLAFVANSLVFLLIGVHEARQNFIAIWFPALVAIVLTTLARAAAVYSCCFVFHRSSQRVSWQHQHALLWGGFKGALALALALGLPPDLPARDQILAVSFAVVAFSIFVQGLTMAPLLRKMGEIPR
jgi:CPA1 family monovalent cation:H+ antiporter